MEQTYLVNAVVLDKTPWREADARVFLYSREVGRLDLVVRGARKLNSKLGLKLEPFTAVETMVVVGRQFSYVGGVAGHRSFPCLHQDLDKLKVAGLVSGLYLDLIKDGASDARLYDLLINFLNLLDSAASRMVLARFLGLAAEIKTMMMLGIMAEARFCNVCYNQLSGSGWLVKSGEFVCRSCRPPSDAEAVEMGGVAMDFLGRINRLSFEQAVKTGRLDKNALLKLELAIETVRKNQH